MASAKNNNNSAASADSTGGFKTVAFGFDKNDVTLYIASLRKKMKQMEDEFQDKLKEALDNPAASNEALKHEREVIRAEVEAMWGDKLYERNQILKQQQNQINELEASVHEKDKIIDALKAELSAANKEGGGDGSEMNARAAKAYVQFTTTLRSISGSLEKTLQTVENTWKGEFEDAINNFEATEIQQINAAIAQQAAAAPAALTAPAAPAAPAGSATPAGPATPAARPAESAAPVSAPVPNAAPVVDTAAAEAVNQDTDSDNNKKKSKASKKAAKEARTPAPAPEPKPTANIAFEPFDFGDEEDDPLKGIIADISDDIPVNKPEPVKAAEPEIEAVGAEEVNEAPAPVQAEEVIKQDTAADILDDFGDLGDLLAEPESEPAPAPAPTPAPTPAPAPAPSPKSQTPPPAAAPAPAPKNPTPPPAPKMEMDDDLSSLLADDSSDNDIKASDEVVGATDDFADLLAEGSGKPDFGEDLIAEEEPAVVKGDDLDVSLLTNMVITPGEENNGDLNKMLNEQAANEYAQFGDLFVAPAGEDEIIDFQKIAAQKTDGESSMFGTPDSAPKKAEKNEDDLFDFSFLSSDDDEDDMSTDASFPGML